MARHGDPTDAELNEIPVDGDEIHSGSTGDDDDPGDDTSNASVGERDRPSPVRLAVAVSLTAIVTLAGLVSWLSYRDYQSHQVQQQRQHFLNVGRQAALDLTTIDFNEVDADVSRILNSATGTFLDKSKIRPLDHKGRFFNVKGPLNIERCPQGNPVIIQAGGSSPGQELSARSADLVFSVVNGDPVSGKAAYDSLKQRVIKHGRLPEHLPILPGVMPIIGETDAQAKEQLDRLQGWLSSTNALTLVSQRLGHDISGYPLDGPVPELPPTQRGQAFSKILLDMARREKMTLRDLYNVTAAARGHWVIYGTPKRIADIFEEWFTGGMADGFVIMPAYFPGAFDDFVDKVVPELQRRGLYRNEYAGTTLRSHLGLNRREIIRRQAAS